MNTFEFKIPEDCLPPTETTGMDVNLRHIVRKYTRIRACVVQDIPDAHQAFLTVGNQHFCITREPCDSAQEASWFCLMVAKALLNFYFSFAVDMDEIANAAIAENRRHLGLKE
jgi:hypothetical protein